MSQVYESMSIPKDECYTTLYESKRIIRFLLENNIEKSLKIWLPFDDNNSRIVIALKEAGFENVINTSLASGHDLYHYEPKDYDIIFSNPPFSGRTKLIKRLEELGKPYIILQAVQAFNNNYFRKLLLTNKIQLIFPDNRMSFITFNEKQNKLVENKSGIAFYSFWIVKSLNLNSNLPFIELPLYKDIIHIKEEFDSYGRVVENDHLTIFNWKEKI